MIVCPNAKINIGLEVVSKRPDGFHDLETVFYPVVELRDVLEVVKAGSFDLIQYGLPCDCPVEKNLCYKAYKAVKERFDIDPVNIYLYKNIPMGAGLGGGSADAAFTIIALNEVFGLGLNKAQMAGIAAGIGSDCPFFIYNRPMLAHGRGEVLEPLDLDLSPYRIEVVTPCLHISTAEAYAGVDALKFTPAAADVYGSEPLAVRLKQDILKWRESVINDFEAVAFAKYSALKDIKKDLYARGAAYASMTGSGSAFYGLFAK